MPRNHRDPQDIVSIGQLWPNMSMMYLPYEFVAAIQETIRRMNPEVLRTDGHPDSQLMQALVFPETPRPRTSKIYRECINRWASEGADYRKDAVQDLSALDTVLAYKGLTISDIYYDIVHKRFCSIHFTEVAWRWRYYQFAFTVYWALFFHVPNEHLRHPDLILTTVFSLFERIHSEVKEIDSKKELVRRRRALLLALYERTLGIRYDINTRQPHYVANIERRKRLTAEECKQRVQLFGRAVDDILARLERLLIQK